MNGSPRWNRALLYPLSGITLILFLFIFNSCKLDNVDVSFSRVYIRNLLSTDTADQITNIEAIPYNEATMSGTVTDMSNSGTKNTGLSSFINRTDLFPWKNNSSSLTIEYDQSYSIYLDNCEQPVIIRIENAFPDPSPNEYSKKYFYTLLNPPRCGKDYYIDIIKTTDP